MSLESSSITSQAQSNWTDDSHSQSRTSPTTNATQAVASPHHNGNLDSNEHKTLTSLAFILSPASACAYRHAIAMLLSIAHATTITATNRYLLHQNQLKRQLMVAAIASTPPDKRSCILHSLALYSVCLCGGASYLMFAKLDTIGSCI